MTTTRAIDAASSWMLDNGFEEGKCLERSANTLKLRYVPPEPLTTTDTTEAPTKKKSKGTTETTTETTPKPTKKTKSTTNTTETEKEEKKTKKQDQET